MGSPGGSLSLLRYNAASNHNIPVLLVSLLLCCVLLKAAADPSAIYYSQLEILEAKQHLRKLREATLYTIQSLDGDTIDCILREKQPAFDHPLLKNHTLQEAPSSNPKGALGEEMASLRGGVRKNSLYGMQVWHKSGRRCPMGTIPVRRPSLPNLLHSRNYRKSTSPLTSLVSAPHPCKEYAVGRYTGSVHGTCATLSLWNPLVTVPSDKSITQLWLFSGNGKGTALDTIEVGWMVNPLQSNDTKTRFFIYWTNDNYHGSGCGDLSCPGFIQVSNQIVLGGALEPVSIFYQRHYELAPLMVYKDMKGHWWLKSGFTDIGYWPGELFKNGLAKNAQAMQWGGEIVNSWVGGLHTNTEMGSGHFAEEGEHGASYVRDIFLIDQQDFLDLPPKDSINFYATNTSCYSVAPFYNEAWPSPFFSGENPPWPSDFFFGGPGRSPYCP